MFSFLMNFFKTNSVDKIISRLWLGDYKSALDIDFLLNNNIDLIINCTPNTQFFYETTDLNLLNSICLILFLNALNILKKSRKFIK